MALFSSPRLFPVLKRLSANILKFKPALAQAGRSKRYKNGMIREISPADFDIVKALRLDALANNPEAFGTSVEEERLQTREVFEDSFKTGRLFGYFIKKELIGIAGFYTFSLSKMSHRCQLFGVYVLPVHRGKGIASLLIGKVCEVAGETKQQIHLNVWTGNPTALALYQKLGFTIYGTEPATMMIDGVAIDDHMMVKHLQQ